MKTPSEAALKLATSFVSQTDSTSLGAQQTILDWAAQIDAAFSQDTMKSALTAALPVLEQHAEDERTFWGKEDKHGLATEAEAVYAAAKAALLSVNPSA